MKATCSFAYRPYLMFKQEEQTGWDTLWKSMIVAAIFVGLIIAVTSLIVFAYFMKWYKVRSIFKIWSTSPGS
uniref:Uncharacterized protein n=1 Tax=Parascaris equorum TaxID=6256 RepID=A0A914RP76_PAREQ